MAISVSHSDSDSDSSSVSESAKDSDMVGACSVCLDDQGSDENPLVYCDGCDLAVHQACYGIVDVPSGRWFCRKCESQERSAKIRCELCPSKQGALKRTENNGWAHVVCALYIPEVRFGNNNTMEPIETRHIPPERFNRCCYLCEEKNNASNANYGACMHCNKLGCKQSFHATCAQSSGLLCEEASQVSENIVYCGYCKHHFNKLKTDTKRASSRSNNSLSNSNSTISESSNDSSHNAELKCNNNGTDKSSKQPINILNTLSSSQAKINSDIKSPKSSSFVTSQPTSFASPTHIAIAMQPSVSKTSSNGNSQSQKKKKSQKVPLSSTTGDQASNTSSPSVPHIDINPSSKNHPSLFGWSNKNSTTSSNDYNEGQASLLLTTSNSSCKSNSKKKTSGAIPKIKLSSCTTNLTLQKLSSPNLSVSTSSSSASLIASPSPRSTSTTSASLSSPSASSKSSTSITPSSDSSSSALSSPNISIRPTVIKIDSPLISSSKNASLTTLNSEPTSSNTQHSEKLHPIKEDILHSQNHQSSSIADIKRHKSTDNPISQSSLLSTVSAHSNLNNSSTTSGTDTSFTYSNSSISTNSPVVQSNTASINHSNKKNLCAKNSGTYQPATSQLRVPPLVISVNQSTSGDAIKEAKIVPKSKSPKISKQKQSVNTEKQPSQTKPKPSRVKKNVKSDKSTKTIRRKSNSDIPANENKDETINLSSKIIADSKMVSKIDDKSANKRKSRTSSNEQLDGSSSKPKRSRKKASTSNPNVQASNSVLTVQASNTGLPLSTISSEKPSIPVPTTSRIPFNSSFLNQTSIPLMIKPPVPPSIRIPMTNQSDLADLNRFCSPMMSPFLNLNSDCQLSRPGSSSSAQQTAKPMYSTLTAGASNGHNQNQHQSLTKSQDSCSAQTFTELSDGSRSQLSKFVLEQAQQFDIPSLIGLLYTLRGENEKMLQKVRELANKREQQQQYFHM